MTTVFNRIGPYRISSAIGHGGMSVVFLAIDTRTERQVALKLVQQGTDREAAEIVEAERFGAQLQQQFSDVSAHVPAVYEYGADEESGYFFVAMEYLDGENLSEVITRGPLPIDRAAAVAIELCRFLEEAHRFEVVIDGRSLRSLLHLDLKPRNVRITAAGHVKVLDFGISKALSLSRKVTRNDFGSVAYLSPERLETGEVDAGADFWALGVMLHEMLSGAPPFRAPDTRRLERLILSRRPAPPLPAHCPAGLQAIAARLLGPAAGTRYTTATEIREDFERVRDGQRTAAEEQGWPHGFDEQTTRVDEQTTRRTWPAADEEEKTRRTRPGGAEPAPLTAAAAPRSRARRALAAIAALGAWRNRPQRIVAAVLLVIVFGVVVSELRVARAARRVAGAVATQELDQLLHAWAEHQRLDDRSYLGLGTLALEHTLIQRTSDLAGRVMANYRTPSPTVREAQWAQARDALARALAVDPGNSRLRAMLRYCEGHLHRINGEAKRQRRQFDEARRDLAEAVVAFRQAAELRPGWPDPFLGLARTFIYGLDDVEHGADALRQAQQHGHEPSARELAQLADGYRMRGDILVRSAREVVGLPQERDYLTRATEAYRESLELYSQAGSFANVPANVRLTQRALLQVEETLARLPAEAPDPAAPLEPEDQPSLVPLQGSTLHPGGAPWL